MQMDPQLEDLYGSLHRIKFNDQMAPTLASRNFGNMVKVQDSHLNSSFVSPPLMSPSPNFNLVVPSVITQVQDNEGGLHEDYDFSDVILKYINQVLMEEDEGGKSRLPHEPSALEAAEKSLYEVLGEEYPPPQDQCNVPNAKHDSRNGNGNSVSSCITYSYSGDSSCNSLMGHNRSSYVYEYNPVLSENFSVSSSRPPLQISYSSSDSSGRRGDALQSSLESSISSASNTFASVDGPAESPVSALSVSDIFNDSQSILQFQKGLEEASKFLPKCSLYEGLRNIGSSFQKSESWAQDAVVKPENRHKNGTSVQGTRGKKHRHPEELLSEGRDTKQSAISLVSDEAVERSEMFDRVLLCSGGKNDAALREALQSELNKNVQNVQAKGSNGGRGRGRKQGSKPNVVDLRSLLSLCAQAVASNDRRSADDLLRQIRQHCSSTGDGNQRMAHYFLDGLEARLAGVGTPIYSSILTGPASAVDILRAYHMFLAICPFKKIGNFFSNKSIRDVAEKATRVHIIDIGMVYGFQWPCLFQRLSSRPGGPPGVRITGVDLPQPGFRPAKRLEEAGRRLKNYAESFNIPFEFHAVAKKWETVTVDDLKIDNDELLIVNCLFRFKYIPEETAMMECPRDIFLNLIRKIKPSIFIQGVVNGAFNSPFFITRFREALFHFSTLFDMLEANLPRDTQERMLIEREIFGRQAMNVIACEGLERIERPETYKQWQVRNERAGFKQLPLNREIMDMATKRVKSVYHKDFSIDEDGQWLLQGWKGRVVYALTIWKPV